MLSYIESDFVFETRSLIEPDTHHFCYRCWQAAHTIYLSPLTLKNLVLKTHTTIPSFCGLCESKFKYYAVLHTSSIGPLPWAQVVWFVLILIFQISHIKVLSLSFPLANSSQISPNKIRFTLFLRRKRKRRQRRKRQKRRWRKRNCGTHFFFSWPDICPPLACGWYNQCHPFEETWSSLVQKIALTNSFLISKGTLCSFHIIHAEILSILKLCRIRLCYRTISL